ncbi:hypothetical protein ACJ72_07488 [Emergomyces africanus]|uniref:Uncharacterized protein n=1 Tax=Emergomyces africanus TaxID=1955775 RepID=A0A1B7NNJ9_9EURO|nr:hypothetical protein ACJ72_07488 [Emergomyces africanus]
MSEEATCYILAPHAHFRPPIGHFVPKLNTKNATTTAFLDMVTGMAEDFRPIQYPLQIFDFGNNIHFSVSGLRVSTPLFTLPSSGRQTCHWHPRCTLLGCQIIANNVFECSYLALDREGLRRVYLELNDILLKGEYYLITYAVVPSFKDWQFAHGRIPSSWPEWPCERIYTNILTNAGLLSSQRFQEQIFAKPFVTSGYLRQMIQLHVSTDADSEQQKWNTQFIDGEQLVNLFTVETDRIVQHHKRGDILPGVW